MRLTILCVCLAAPLLRADSPTGREVLDNVRAAYLKLKAVHILAQREESTIQEGRSAIAAEECELAIKGGRYRAYFKIRDQEALAVSDGSNIWKALVSGKKWSKVSAAALVDDDEEAGNAASQEHDLHGNLVSILLGPAMGLSKAAEESVVVKEQDYKLGHDKIRCYLVRATAGHAQHELLVDKERFLILQDTLKSKGPEGASQFTTKVKSLESNEGVDDSLFRFEPKPEWKEVEMLILPGEGQVPLVGSHATNFTLPVLDGGPVALAGLRGKVVVLDFWATWCPPCRAELPNIEKLRAEFQGKAEFYGINDEGSDAVKRFLKSTHYEMPVLMDDKRQVHRLYHVRAIPTLLVLDRGSVIRQHFVGERSMDALRKAIQSVVNSQ